MGFLIFIRNDKWVAASPLMAGNVGEENARLYRAAGSEGEDGKRARTV